MTTPDLTKPPSRRWFALALLCAAQFMVVLDFSIVNMPLPVIQKDLGFSQQNLQWIVSAYALTFEGFLLSGGRAAHGKFTDRDNGQVLLRLAAGWQC